MCQYFKHGMGVFVCEVCRHRTRGSHDIGGLRQCKNCVEDAEHYNLHMDMGKNWKCEDKNCKYNKEEVKGE